MEQPELQGGIGLLGLLTFVYGYVQELLQVFYRSLENIIKTKEIITLMFPFLE